MNQSYHIVSCKTNQSYHIVSNILNSILHTGPEDGESWILAQKEIWGWLNSTDANKGRQLFKVIGTAYFETALMWHVCVCVCTADLYVLTVPFYFHYRK